MPGEFEPNDSRNVTGTASTPDGRWTAQGQEPPLANGQSPMNGGGSGNGGLSEDDEDEDMGEGEDADEGDEGSVEFEPDDELIRKVGDDAAGQDQSGGSAFGSNGS
ncbi:MAG: hypothetical protein ACKOW1_03130 [Novosphingobium sp.]